MSETSTTMLRHGKVRLALHRLAGGDGRPLLLLHGLGEASTTAVPAWAQGWPGPVAALDFTGHGASTVPRGGGYTAEMLLADADAALAELGELTATCDATGLPPLAEIDPDGSYLAWTLRLATEATADQVSEVFAFVEGLCSLDITLHAEEPAAVAPELEPPEEAPVDDLAPPSPEPQAAPAATVQAAPSPPVREAPRPSRCGEWTRGGGSGGRRLRVAASGRCPTS